MTPAHGEEARQILATETADTTSPGHLGTGTAKACEKLAKQLAPIIGDVGIRALLDRGLTLTKAQFPWLAHAGATPAEWPWTQLRNSIAQQEPGVALEGSAALLASFLELLGRLIGAGLTARLVHDLWPAVFPLRSSKETK